MKVALIGIGRMGGCHFANYKKMDDVEIVAVADVRRDMAQEKAGGNIKIYSTLDEVLANEKPDIIDICTPSYLHAELAIKALESGANVICEKPMTLNSADAEKVLAVAEKSKGMFMVAHVVRFMKPYVYLRHIIKTGELGKLIRLDMKRLSGTPTWSWEDWMRDIKKSGGTPMDLMIHDVDFIQSVLGMPEKIVGAYRSMRKNSDYASADMIYGDAVVSAEATWYNANFPFGATYLAVFENGYVRFDGKLVKNGEEIDLNSKKDTEDLGINVGNDDGYNCEIRYFIDCVKSGRKPTEVTPGSSAQSVRLIESIKNSVMSL